MNDNIKNGFQISGRFTIRDLIWILTALGLGGHSLYTGSNMADLQRRLDRCEARMERIERAFAIPALPPSVQRSRR